jgi:hypothetical protein
MGCSSRSQSTVRTRCTCSRPPARSEGDVGGGTQETAVCAVQFDERHGVAVRERHVFLCVRSSVKRLRLLFRLGRRRAMPTSTWTMVRSVAVVLTRV